MKKKFIFFVLFLFFLSNTSHAQTSLSITIDTVLNEKISIRAMVVDKDKVWYAGNNNQVGYYNFRTGEKLEKQIKNDTLKLEFRSMAQNSKAIFIANIGNPAFIYKMDKSDLSVVKVYSENHEKVFYDSMHFWNEKEGIAIGDPTEDCLSIIITRDGGKSWEKTACDNLPKIAEGEAAFAASNTNICIKGNKTWVVSGGVKSRVFSSEDKGITWSVTEVPIVQGKAMTGIFTADFYNKNTGIVAGGNYEVPEQNFQNKAITVDGGKTWNLIAENTGFGYASCVQYIPKSKGKQIVTVGAGGLYYSADGGNSWKQLSQDKSLFTIRFADEQTAFAAGKDKIIRITFKK
ncbi:sialidase family protein [Flavobacterium phycosphaerae]|uniref:sialidase family protein n=1 Tax=Flavobacterium phycosphaerae TaxID=2697515 RepID=UPI00138AC928|nr:oxidoreductase [Flavobacterium phycosphaerae]